MNGCFKSLIRFVAGLLTYCYCQLHLNSCVAADTSLETEKVRIEGDEKNLALKLSNDKAANTHQDDLARQVRATRNTIQ